MRFETRLAAWTVPASMAGAAAAMIFAAPSAGADPLAPEPVLPVDPAVPAPEVPGEVVAAPPAEVPHLTSPDNLPPGTSAEPVGPQQGRGVSYLRELWHAYQTQDVSGGDALLLLTQRPLNADSPPPAGAPPEAVPPGQVPDPAAVVPAPVDPAAVPAPVDPAAVPAPVDPAAVPAPGAVAPLPTAP